MDLRARLALAGGALLALLDASADYLPTGGYEVAHDLGRWWDAILRLEQTIGCAIPPEYEAGALRHVQRLTDNPDGLLMAPGGCINPHNLRESLLTYGGLAARRDSAWARQAGLRLVEAMSRALRPDGHLDFTQFGCWGQAPSTTDPSHAEPERHGWFDGTATSGRALEALVWFFQATGEDRVLTLATRIAEHHLAHSIDPRGTVRPEILHPENVGHDHSYHGTLRGLLLYGLLTGQRRYVDAVEATYRHGVRGKIVTWSGWAPHDLGMMRFPNEHGDPVADPASAGDSAQIALWLAVYAGCTDLFDDVERLVRARLLPIQLTPDDIAHHPERTFAPRDIGAWPIHGACHAGKGCTPDVLAAVTHSLCDIQRHLGARTEVGRRVDLHFDYQDADLAVTSRRGQCAEVAVTVFRPNRLLLRIPNWAPDNSVTLEIDGTSAPVHRLGAYAWIEQERVQPGSRVVLTYELPERTIEEPMPSGRVYTFRWRGDEILGISPQDETAMPFYPSCCGESSTTALHLP
jgi:hypothetical protein